MQYNGIVEVLQKVLKATGHDPGPIDGFLGNKTAAAIASVLNGKEFEAAQKKYAKDGLMPWYDVAKKLMGTKEVRGKGSNPKITGWAKRMKIWYPNDGVPWCGLFVAQCISAALPFAPTPKNVLGARNWLKFGKSCKPQLGAVLVFWRGSRKGWKGHVGFYAGEDKNAYHVLGGNQSDSVNIRRISKSRLLGARWPGNMPEAGKVVHLTARGKLSKNEA